MNMFQQVWVDEFDHYMSLATNYVSAADTTDMIRMSQRYLYDAYGVLLKIQWYKAKDKAFKKEFQEHYDKALERYDTAFEKAVDRLCVKPEDI